ncbi:hypothetical protein ACWGNN_48695, partial [Streptomyces sp. NPDC055817]
MLNTGGNRALNSVLHTIAVCQIRGGGRGQVYYLRQIAEGKTPSEARRALKRRLPNVVYRIMNATNETTLLKPLDTQRRYEVTGARPAACRAAPPRP